MADKRIDQLTAATTMGDDDLLVLQQNNQAKKLSGATLSDYIYDVVEVSNTQPAESRNKVWIKPSSEDLELAEMSDVDEVKTALNGVVNNKAVNVLLNAVWEIGSIGTTGNNGNSTVRIRNKDFLSIDSTFVDFIITSGYRFAAVWYNASKTFLRDDYWYTEDARIYPPTGTAYLRLVVGKVTEETASLNYANEIAALGTPEIVSEIANIETFVNESYPIYANRLLTLQGAIKSNGEIATASGALSGYHRTNYIFVPKKTTIRYQFVRATELTTIAVYDKDLVFDSTNSIGVTTTSDRGVFVMPYDGYVVLSCRNTELNTDRASFIITTPLAEKIGLPPDIWQEYLATKKPSIQSALVAIKNQGESFTFVTDCHIPRNNMVTPQILRYLDAECPVNYHINGGDFIDINTDSVTSAISTIFDWKKSMGNILEYIARGNHDDNNYDGSNTQNRLEIAEFYAITERPIENYINTGGKTYYCIDNETQKIRLIIADNTLSGDNLSSMLTWLTAKLTEKDSTWTELIIQHYLWGTTTSALHNAGQAVIDAVNSVYSQIQADFIGMLAGHTHVDYNDTEETNGYNLIARNANFIQGLGTNSLSFDYVTINTNAKTINFTKIGLGSDLSLQY